MVVFIHQHELAEKKNIVGGGLNLLPSSLNPTLANDNGNLNQTMSSISGLKNTSIVRNDNLTHFWGDNAAQWNTPIFLSKGNYVFSFLYAWNANNDGNQGNIYKFSLNAGISTNFTLAGENGLTFRRAKASFYVGQDIKINQIKLSLDTEGQSLPGGSLWLADFKLESGLVATSWQPCLDDIVSDIKHEMPINAITSLIMSMKNVSNESNISIASTAQDNGFTHYSSCQLTDLPDGITQNKDYLVLTISKVFYNNSGFYQFLFWDGGVMAYRGSWSPQSYTNWVVLKAQS